MGSERSFLRDLAGARVGKCVDERFDLDGLLGLGATGAVYSALDRESGDRVAIKLIHDGLSRSPDIVRRFLREARTTSAIDHPAVIRVFGFGRDAEGHLYQVSELLRGEPLTAAVVDGSLTVEDTIAIGRALLSALEAAHGKNIVHRDVKPDNVFLSRDEHGSPWVKLLDFGIAKTFDSDETWDTVDGLVIGTPHYMSPEQCLGEVVDARTDLWSLGAVLFHAVLGRPPFHADDLGQLLLEIVRERAPSMTELRPDLPTGFTTCVDRALEPSRSLRWQTARDMANALTAPEW